MSAAGRGSLFSGPIEGLVFAIVMAAAAFLGRENPRFAYPEVLYGFAGLLAFNLLNFALLPRFLGEKKRTALAVSADILFLTLVLSWSGGAQSYFWVLLLLPVFNGCLVFGPRGVVAVTAAALAPLLSFHAAAAPGWHWGGALEPLIKAAIVAASAAVVVRVAGRERQARRRLEEERRRADSDRASARERLQRMDRLATLGTLSAGIAHELKTPLAAIIGYAQVAADGALPPAETERIFGRIAAAAHRCDGTIQNMLALARQKTGARRPCDVNALVRECAALAQHDWVHDRIGLEEDYAADLPPAVVSGPELQQVVFNLLANARQAIRGAGRGEGRVRLSTRREDDGIAVTVADDGPGVPPDIAERIWEPFFTTKPEGEGTGLGLAICRRIVELHGGTLSLAPGGPGAAFVIRLPAGDGAARSDGATSS